VTVQSIRFQRPDPALVLPFEFRGGTGEVRVQYGVTADPVAVGFDLVATGFVEEGFRGFPVIRASVSFRPEGYRAIFGWLQIISRTTRETGGVEVTVDVPPVLAETGSPLAHFGYLPTMFDAPANPDHPDGEWLAETFLVAVPDIARSRRLVALIGFRWGYQLTARKPTSLPIGPLNSEHWNQHCPMLASSYRDWSFIESEQA
jgi:hypothetical protein